MSMGHRTTGSPCILTMLAGAGRGAGSPRGRAQVEDIVRQRCRVLHAEEQRQMMLCMPGMLTQGGGGSRGAAWPPLRSRLHRIPTSY